MILNHSPQFAFQVGCPRVNGIVTEAKQALPPYAPNMVYPVSQFMREQTGDVMNVSRASFSTASKCLSVNIRQFDNLRHKRIACNVARIRNNVPAAERTALFELFCTCAAHVLIVAACALRQPAVPRATTHQRVWNSGSAPRAAGDVVS